MDSKNLKCFVSYSHKDKTICDRFKNHLDALSRLHNFEYWYDGQINAGQDIDKEVLKNLTTSDIVFLLITPDYLASYYCYEKELGIAIKRHREGKCIVVPVICKKYVQGRYFFSHLKFVPTDGRPINTFRPQDDGFINACTGISNLITDFLSNQKPSANKQANNKSTQISQSMSNKNNKNSKNANESRIKFLVVKNGQPSAISLNQGMFNALIEYSLSFQQFISKINEIVNKQLQSLSTLITSKIPEHIITAYEKNNLEIFMMQLFSYIQQIFIGIDNTCANFRFKKEDKYISFLNIGYPSVQLSTEPIESKGGMINCSIDLNSPVIKSYNKKLHDATHPNEKISRDYITFTFNKISRLYNVDISMCISIVGKNSSKQKETLIPLTVLEFDQLIENFLIQYISSCIEIDPKYNLNNILNTER